MNSELATDTVCPTRVGGQAANASWRLTAIRYPLSAIRSLRAVRAILLTAALGVLMASPAAAKIAVFTDGRILKVEDAYLDGDRIVLALAEGGRLVVPAVRIDRVVADEVEEQPEPVVAVACEASWRGSCQWWCADMCAGGRRRCCQRTAGVVPRPPMIQYRIKW